MSLQIDDIVNQLKSKYYEANNPDTWWATKAELENIILSEFRFIEQHIKTKNLKEINIIHLGKIRPSKWFIYNKERLYGKKLEQEV